MIGWLIYHKQDAKDNNSFIEWIIEEASKQNIQLQLMIREKLHITINDQETNCTYEGKQVSCPEFVIVRTIEPSLQFLLEQLQIPTFNDYRTAMICNDKALTYMHVRALGIPMLDTLFFHSKDLPKHPPFPFPFVLKNALGRGGNEVFFIDSKEKYTNITQKLPFSSVIVQKANVQLGKDLRVFIIGKEIIGAVLRHNQNDFRANFKLGGSATYYSLNNEEKAHVQKIVDHFSFDFVGIDFLIGDDGQLIFNEIEDVVGSRILSETTSINTASLYIKHIKKSVRK